MLDSPVEQMKRGQHAPAPAGGPPRTPAAGPDGKKSGYVCNMTEPESEQKKVVLTAVRIPLLILGALILMLVIGIVVVG